MVLKVQMFNVASSEVLSLDQWKQESAEMYKVSNRRQQWLTSFIFRSLLAFFRDLTSPVKRSDCYVCGIIGARLSLAGSWVTLSLEEVRNYARYTLQMLSHFLCINPSVSTAAHINRTVTSTSRNESRYNTRKSPRLRKRRQGPFKSTLPCVVPT